MGARAGQTGRQTKERRAAHMAGLGAHSNHSLFGQELGDWSLGSGRTRHKSGEGGVEIRGSTREQKALGGLQAGTAAMAASHSSRACWLDKAVHAGRQVDAFNVWPLSCSERRAHGAAAQRAAAAAQPASAAQWQLSGTQGCGCARGRRAHGRPPHTSSAWMGGQQ